uniref:(northern house mosquito) hypothetical protein n=1 Tax=Culex pipiens TaxID=7175 RepID=A0A8D8EWC5_CULPI
MEMMDSWFRLLRLATCLKRGLKTNPRKNFLSVNTRKSAITVLFLVLFHGSNSSAHVFVWGSALPISVRHFPVCLVCKCLDFPHFDKHGFFSNLRPNSDLNSAMTTVAPSFVII